MEEKDQGEKNTNWRTREKERERKVGNERDGTIDSIIFRKSRAFVDDSSSLPYPLSENRITE